MIETIGRYHHKQINGDLYQGLLEALGLLSLLPQCDLVTTLAIEMNTPYLCLHHGNNPVSLGSSPLQIMFLCIIWVTSQNDYQYLIHHHKDSSFLIAPFELFIIPIFFLLIVILF